MKVSDKARTRIAKHQELMGIKREYGLSKFYLYRYRSSTTYMLSRSEWLSFKDKQLIFVNEPGEFISFVTHPNRFCFDEQPDRYYINIHDFIEEYLIIKIARI